MTANLSFQEIHYRQHKKYVPNWYLTRHPEEPTFVDTNSGNWYITN